MKQLCYLSPLENPLPSYKQTYVYRIRLGMAILEHAICIVNTAKLKWGTFESYSATGDNSYYKCSEGEVAPRIPIKLPNGSSTWHMESPFSISIGPR